MVENYYEIYPIQFSADVVACNRDPATNLVEVLDTYNVPFPIRNNVVDPTQDVILFNSSFDGARISCTLVEPLLSPVRTALVLLCRLRKFHYLSSYML